MHAAVGQGAAACLRIVGSAESRRLDREYRGKDQPTNVLSFPSSPEERVATGILGDLVICAPVVAREAREQRKTLRARTGPTWWCTARCTCWTTTTSARAMPARWRRSRWKSCADWGFMTRTLEVTEQAV